MGPNLLQNNPFEIARINSKPLMLDGSIGSYLQQKGFEIDDNLWTTNINRTNPDEVFQIHQEYIDAGADIITSNTFRTNPISLSKAGIGNAAKYVKEAVELAKQAAIGTNVLIAGSNPPAEDCYQTERTLSKNELEKNHRYHIDLLVDNGVNFILNETQSHFDELRIICEHCDKNSISCAISLYVLDTLKILSGERLESVLSFLNNHDVLTVGINCISPKLFLKIIGSIELSKQWGFYLNCGSGQSTDKIIICGIQPDEYLGIVKKSMSYKPSFIGACCGSNPSHTQNLRDYLDGQNYS
ncbi:MAG: homocysteine S-methyltransferase family protein [Ignavibacteriaceae bacterium]|nr:homocysteine S-methyltransferase family protein [Ignavibacteriaceae bacterium]